MKKTFYPIFCCIVGGLMLNACAFVDPLAGKFEKNKQSGVGVPVKGKDVIDSLIGNLLGSFER